MGIVFQQLCKAQQHLFACSWCLLVPAAIGERSLGGGNGDIYVAAIARGDFSQGGAGRRVAGNEGVAALGCAEAPVDERLGAVLHVRRDRGVLFFAQQLAHLRLLQ